MRLHNPLLCGVAASICAVLAVGAGAQTPKPKRINRAIELLAQGQPVYYAGSHSGTSGSYEQGVKDAQTYADYLSYDMEHAPYDIMTGVRSARYWSTARFASAGANASGCAPVRARRALISCSNCPR